MYVVNNYIVCLFVQGTAEKQLADAVSLVKKLGKKATVVYMIVLYSSLFLYHPYSTYILVYTIIVSIVQITYAMQYILLSI